MHKKKKKYTEKEMTIVLAKAIMKRKNLHKKWNLKKWEIHFNKLHRLDKNTLVDG